MVTNIKVFWNYAIFKSDTDWLKFTSLHTDISKCNKKLTYEFGIFTLRSLFYISTWHRKIIYTVSNTIWSLEVFMENENLSELYGIEISEGAVTSCFRCSNMADKSNLLQVT